MAKITTDIKTTDAQWIIVDLPGGHEVYAYFVAYGKYTVDTEAENFGTKWYDGDIHITSIKILKVTDMNHNEITANNISDEDKKKIYSDVEDSLYSDYDDNTWHVLSDKESGEDKDIEKYKTF